MSAKTGKGRGRRVELWLLGNAKAGGKTGGEEGGVGREGSGGKLLDKLCC